MVASPPELVGEEPEVTLIVPILSDKAEVGAVIEGLGNAMEALGRTWEAILVYSGVSGSCWEEGLALQSSSQQQVRTIQLHKSFGEAVCLSSAFHHARGRWILTSPQYIQVDPSSLANLFERADDGADFVTSWRSPRVDAWLNRLQSSVFNAFLRRLVGTRFHDVNCTLRLMRREVLEQMTIYGTMYRYLPAIAHHRGFRVDEVRVRHVAEIAGGVGWHGPGVYLRRSLDILGVVFLTKFTHKPLRFFGALGGLAMLGGGITAIVQVALWIYFDDMQGLYQRPLFLLGVLGFVLGVQIVGFGLVGEIVIFTQARNVREYRIENIDE
ncbi:MAG TPA: glycosyltransferase [Planctomycetes bacterium]|nr:glycosyltransferase [Planctomycetota bacterium]HIK60220.1 glycosyltransferase [Planctomycetota bacterium]